MKRFSSVLLFLLSFVPLLAQQNVSGTVRDASTGEVLVGAVVVADGGKQYTTTNIDGQYKISLPRGDHFLQVRYTGYAADSVKITVADKPVVLDLNCNNKAMTEVEVFADVAIDRHTPIPFSNVNAKQIHQELGGNDLPMLLNSTPGIYATQQGGGSGDARVNVRGADQRNVGVLVDGVPMNDMENGQVYWSNWSGLGDVTRTMQVQRGLGASKLAIPSVGGTINILTNGIDQKREFVMSSEFGSNNMQKLAFGFNSGEFGHGWGMTFAGGRKTGTGWADQTWTDEYSYFFKVQKRFDAHLFSLSINGAPQTHAQRYDRLPIGIYDRKFAEQLGIDVDSLYAANNGYTTPYQGERGLRYNPNWGPLIYETGEKGVKNQDVNFFHKPLVNFSWYWTPTEKILVTTVAYLSIGHGGGTNFNNPLNRDTTTGQLKVTDAYNANRSTIDALYSSTEHKSSRVLLASMNDHVWYGAMSTATWMPNEKFSMLFGVDVRHYKGSHYRKVYDLMGGDYFIDAGDKNQPNGIDNLSYSMKRNGDRVGYFNDSYVDWGGLFAQGEYSGENWSVFLTVTGSMTQYQRVDHFKKRDIVKEDGTVIPMIVGYNETYYTNGTQSGVAQNGAAVTFSGDTTYINNPSGADYAIYQAKGYAWSSESARTAETVKKTFPGYTVKTGFNYNIDEHFNVYTNIGYLNMAPRFNTVFDNNNKEYPGIKQQQVYAFELGTGIRFGQFASNVNTYFTNWLNKPPVSSPTTTIAGDPFTYDLTGLNTRLLGIEFDGKWKIIDNLEVQAFTSFGDWTYQSSGRVYLYDANYVLEDSVDYSAKGVHLGDAAQTQVGGSVRWEPLDGLYIKPQYTFFGRNFATFDPIVLVPVYNGSHVVVGDNRDRESWRVPSYGLLDLFMGYELKQQMGKTADKNVNISFMLIVNNLLNTKYVSDATNGADFDALTALVYMGLGRRWSAGMRVNF